jgi:4-hydroxyacetophenone monooxygenase
MLPYYRDAFGKIRMVLPWRMVDYFHMTRRPDLTDFELTYASSARSVPLGWRGHRDVPRST